MTALFDPVMLFVMVYGVIWLACALELSATTAVFLAAGLLFAFGERLPPLETGPRLLDEQIRTMFTNFGVLSVFFAVAAANMIRFCLFPRGLAKEAGMVAAFTTLSSGSAAMLPDEKESVALFQAEDADFQRDVLSSVSVLSVFSVPLIVASMSLELSMSQVMLSALIPVVGLAVVAGALSIYLARKRNLPRSDEGFEFRNFLFVLVLAALFLLVLYSGKITSLEALSLVVAALLIYVAVMRKITGLRLALKRSVHDFGGIVLLLISTNFLAISVGFGGYVPMLGEWNPFQSHLLMLGTAFAFGAVAGPLVSLIALIPFTGSLALSAGIAGEQFAICTLLSAAAASFLRSRWTASHSKDRGQTQTIVWTAALLGSAVILAIDDRWINLVP